MYTLNGLPASYQGFKTAIRTNLQPLNLDDFYSLLCSEETNLENEAARALQSVQIPDKSVALNATPTRGSARQPYRNARGRGRFSSSRGGRTVSPRIECQICGKLGHSAEKCWHRTNLNYIKSNPSAFVADATDRSNNTTDWILDTGATSHITNDPTQMLTAQPYLGSQQVQVGNGQSLPITHSGHGLLPTPKRSENQSFDSFGSLP
ncbi:hypothetical protein KFK09_012627 [Dendrobium nobile]|uniref:Retrovirus-related Pol polyprotein from transposon TNT 1-94-like beta-barrel domain-containing protein n=1 Tax=Dendrobium nobile TaxID=94219 RepID=A0A8T3BHX1_DENNO|nr:hypothetical protein KFK09_012627 [Dendrobium nobile]